MLNAKKREHGTQAMNWLRYNASQYLPTIADVQPNGKRPHRFWQRGGGYDRNLRTVRDIHEKVAYIHQNPVTRGLESQAEDYAWSSAMAWKTGVDEPLSIERESMPRLTILDDHLNSKLM